MGQAIEGRFRIELDFDLCQGHGVCAAEAPDIFAVAENRLGYAKVRLLDPAPGPTHHAALRNAAKYCPNRVIRIVMLED
ncbi:ferredoxin [Caenibius sp. WL]|uniref:ferredoxin n=1 Tax=Caenibius sp. WL TaxID=2872646 RepID=UPI001C996142|nr:ferredoxin [Caenibius sp. WL]QZP08735.1 ferredoxin [Caenibius sp. WL]